MVDLVQLQLGAGNGGDGRISFYRNRYQPKGGPDGGDGGRGGSVVLVADGNMHSLRDFAGKIRIEAKSGQMGGKQKSFGADADDVLVRVPAGTSLWRIDGEFQTKVPRHMYTIDLEGVRREWHLPRVSSQPAKLPTTGHAVMSINPENGSIQVQTPEAKKIKKTFHMHGKDVLATWMGEVVSDGEKLVAVAGGKGGRGNWRFRSSTHTTPHEAEMGEGGENGSYILELHLLADAGFVGFPNVGKSTLLSVLTKAKPEIANYPFTTIEPNLGVLAYESVNPDERASFLLADIPGIIEGASEGKGLGLAFLRHIERCRVLVFIVALEEHDVLSHADDPNWIAGELLKQYEQLDNELKTYDVSLLEKHRIILVGKADVYPEELKSAVAKRIAKTAPVLMISGKTMEGIEELRLQLRKLLSV